MLEDIKRIRIEDYTYPLEQERIAQYPLEQRDQSKLMIAKEGQIQEDTFFKITDYLPSSAMIVFNETRVIHARMHFQKSTGAKIEVFCLEPLAPTKEIQSAFEVQGSTEWKCLIGNAKKWKSGLLSKDIEIDGTAVQLNVERLGSEGNAQRVRFSWTPEEIHFSKIIEYSGSIPLPPYMNRDSELDDSERYQTVYAKQEGSVAAPTAGLHFTDRVLENLANKQIQKEYISLHVGAGTFKPVDADEIGNHEMHREQIVFSKENIQNLLAHNPKPIIAVGTTSTRSLESLYWFGAKLMHNTDIPFHIDQWDPYELMQKGHLPSLKQSLEKVLEYMELRQLDQLNGDTQLMIVPSYPFQVVDVLITNFHQPKSTLLLLVAAFYGADWKEAYAYAVDHDFRFLSYGDSCVFFKKEKI
jgi:S-adenosylmethionine:tRNA ribosyltransferase-isomerase